MNPMNVDRQKIRESDLPEVIKREVEDMISWDFSETWYESEVLFSMLERGIFHRVIDRVENLGLMEENFNEVRSCYERIAERLLDHEYMLMDFIFPRTLYMKCIRSLVYSTCRPCYETCWFHLLPRQMRLHVTYFQHLQWFIDERYSNDTLLQNE